jgi:hypothetical protein
MLLALVALLGCPFADVVAPPGETPAPDGTPDPDATPAPDGGGTNPLALLALPRVVGAVSTGNLTVRVTFSKPMSASAEDHQNYSIVQASEEGEAAHLFVESAAFVDSSGQTVVELTTLGQANVLYRLRVVNVTDSDGNHIAPASLLADGAETMFAGIPPVEGDIIIDTDGDGFADWFEMVGWAVTVTFADGSQSTALVTSDPFNPDTDGDGVTDGQENRRSLDPRTDDTDADTVTDWDEIFVWQSDPTNQDTDGDGIDDKKEIEVTKTSPTLADTDGDGLSDSQEILESFRNPRVADLPALDVEVGNLRLQIDERFSFTDESGETVAVESSSSSSLTRSADRSRSNGATRETTNVVEDMRRVEGAVEISSSPQITVTGELSETTSNTTGHSSQWEVSSTLSTQRAFEASISQGRELSLTSSVSREIVDASIDVDLSLSNVGDIAFSVSNLEITVLQPTGLARGDYLPVATLLPVSGLVTGESPVFNLGPLNTELGPFIFRSREVFPNLVDELFKEPKGLVFDVANFDMTDEFGRNFAFSNQEVRDRTARIVIDFGDGTHERVFAAVNGAIDDQFITDGTCSNDPGTSCNDDADCNVCVIPIDTADGVGQCVGDASVICTDDSDCEVGGSCEPALVGGFEDNGDARKIPLDFVLQDVLKMEKNPTDDDAIVAGGNGVADTFAAGDDVQEIPPGTTGLLSEVIVVSSGLNGRLDTVPDANDVGAITSGYETTQTCNAASSTPGEACEDDGDCGGGGCDGGEALIRVGNRKTGDSNRIWVVMSSEDVAAAADFGKIALGPGEGIALMFVQDIDGDGILASQEYLYGSSDKSPDSDGDGLGDFAEIRVGWDVAVVGLPLLKVFPNPRVPDGDGDGLEDIEEQDLRLLFGDIGCINSDNSLAACTDDADCPFSGGCVDSDNLGAACTTDEECPIAPTCVGGISAGEACTTDDDCPIAFACTGSDNAGDACAIDADCPIADSQGSCSVTEPGECEFDIFDSDFLTCIRGVNLGAPCGSDFDCEDLKSCVGSDNAGDACTTDADCPIAASLGDCTATLAVCPETTFGVCAQPGLGQCGRPLGRCQGGDDDWLACSADSSCKPVEVEPEVECDDEADCPSGDVCVNLRCATPVLCIASAAGPAMEDVFGPGAAESAMSIDPGLADTDQDGVSDMDEIAGYRIGIAVVDGRNGTGETQALGDDIQLVLQDGPVGNTGVVILPGPNGEIESVPGGDDRIAIGTVVNTNPLDPDSDGDTRLDGDERANGGDPTDPNDPDDFKDSDRDGLTDAAEEGLGWDVTVVGVGSRRVFSNKFTPDTDFDGLPDLLEREIGSDPTKTDSDDDGLSDFDEFGEFAAFIGFQDRYPGFVLDGASSMAIGSDPLNADTDGDGLLDEEEALGGWRVLVLGEVRDVTSNPLFADTDLDGATDQAEKNGKDGVGPSDPMDNDDALDPRDPDTDGDSRFDGGELVGVSDPLAPDIGITIRLVRLIDIFSLEDADFVNTQGGTADNEWIVNVRLLVPSQDIDDPFFDVTDWASQPLGDVASLSTDPDDSDDACPPYLITRIESFTTDIEGVEADFALPLGATILIDGLLLELDNCEDSTTPPFGRSDEVDDCSVNITTAISTSQLSGIDVLPVSLDFMADDTNADGDPTCSGTFVLEIEVH